MLAFFIFTLLAVITISVGAAIGDMLKNPVLGWVVSIIIYVAAFFLVVYGAETLGLVGTKDVSCLTKGV